MNRLSRMKADKVAEFLDRQGRAVVLLATPSLTPDLQAKRKAFLERLNDSGITVLEERLAGITPGAPPGTVSWETIRAVALDFPSATALVILSGFPVAMREDASSSLENAPAVITVSDHLMLYPQRGLLESGLLSLAIVDRPSPPASDQDPKTDEMWFDYYYQVLTPDSVPEGF